MVRISHDYTDPARLRAAAGGCGPPTAATELDGELILGAVGARGARASIRSALAGIGKREGLDFLMTA